VGEEPAEDELDLSAQQLDVYVSRDVVDGWWSPEHGELAVPDGWALLPTGQAYVTRTVKTAGVFWLAWAPRSRSRQHRRLLGLLAPEATISSAQQAAADTEAARVRRRESGARSRQRQEVRYQDDLTRAVIDFLAFAPEHEQLAESIAHAAAGRAAVVGSGRVGRTRVLPLEERADYERHLDALTMPGLGDPMDSDSTDGDVSVDVSVDHVDLIGRRQDDDRYRAVKADAHQAVDAFLLAHRARDG
jgi:hypothetical protein